jgi:hypothetical protein
MGVNWVSAAIGGKLVRMDGEVETKFIAPEDEGRLPCMLINCDTFCQHRAKIKPRMMDRADSWENCLEKTEFKVRLQVDLRKGDS